MVLDDRDIDRFADRSRELWSHRRMSAMKYEESNFLRCCGSCPFASLLAAVITIAGTSIFCACLYYPVGDSIEKINRAFDFEYIDHEWSHILHSSFVFILAIMGGFSLILLIVGSLATGATRHKVYTGFRSRLGGRIATGFFTFIVYIMLLAWLLVLLAMMIPCIGLHVLKHRCDEAWKPQTPSGSPNSASPIVCLTPGTYGLPVPRMNSDLRVCQQKFNDLCALTEHSLRFWIGLVGAFLVAVGLIHFLCCLVANYAHIKDGRKLHDYEEAIREELEISKLNQ